jgi:transaldolase
MKYFLDTANIKQIKQWTDYIDGITTNPFHLKNENFTNIDFIKQLTLLNGADNKKIFLQVNKLKQVKEIIKEWELYDLNFELVFKVSLHPSYYDLIKKIKEKGYKISATTIYDIVQINQAINFGCDYTMVYYHKNKDHSLMEKAYNLKEKTNSNIKLVGASFRNKKEVEKAIICGMDYATVRPQHLSLAFTNDQLKKDLEKLS